MDCRDSGRRPLESFSCFSTSKREKCNRKSLFARAWKTQNSRWLHATIETMSIGIAKTPRGMKDGVNRRRSRKGATKIATKLRLMATASMCSPGRWCSKLDWVQNVPRLARCTTTCEGEAKAQRPGPKAPISTPSAFNSRPEVGSWHLKYFTSTTRCLPLEEITNFRHPWSFQANRRRRPRRVPPGWNFPWTAGLKISGSCGSSCTTSAWGKLPSEDSSVTTAYLYIYIYMCVCVYLRMCINIYIYNIIRMITYAHIQTYTLHCICVWTPMGDKLKWNYIYIYI